MFLRALIHVCTWVSPAQHDNMCAHLRPRTHAHALSLSFLWLLQLPSRTPRTVSSRRRRRCTVTTTTRARRSPSGTAAWAARSWFRTYRTAATISWWPRTTETSGWSGCSEVCRPSRMRSRVWGTSRTSRQRITSRITVWAAPGAGPTNAAPWITVSAGVIPRDVIVLGVWAPSLPSSPIYFVFCKVYKSLMPAPWITVSAGVIPRDVIVLGVLAQSLPFLLSIAPSSTISFLVCKALPSLFPIDHG